MSKRVDTANRSLVRQGGELPRGGFSGNRGDRQASPSLARALGTWHDLGASCCCAETQAFNPMRTPILVLVFALLSIPAWGQEAMTAERFKSIVATPGDGEALRPELAVMPLWRYSKTSITMKFQDGTTVDEECVATAKTVQGKYIVVSLESKFYHQTMHAITGFDDKALAVRNWGLFGDVVTEATVVVDAEKKISASSASYGDGLTELSVSSYSDREASDRALVYKHGVLFMTRVAKTHPIPDPGAAAKSNPPGETAPATKDAGK